jgi:hypothetical protein
MDGHLLTFSAYWFSGIRYPRRLAIQFEVAAIDFDGDKEPQSLGELVPGSGR